MSLRNIIESLRRGEVPSDELEMVLVDRTEILKGFTEDLEYIKGGSSFKTRYLNGVFGSGKTFLLKILEKKALQQNFVTSFVILDERTNRFDKIENGPQGKKA